MSDKTGRVVGCLSGLSHNHWLFPLPQSLLMQVLDLNEHRRLRCRTIVLFQAFSIAQDMKQRTENMGEPATTPPEVGREK